MKRLLCGIVACFFASGIPLAAGSGDQEVSAGAFATQLVDAARLDQFTEQVQVVERELADASGFNRDDLLAMYGRSSAASGRFDVAAAAYAMFLNEFGTSHPYSERIAVRFADCLFPFKYDQIDVIHFASGPRLEPTWRMGYSPRPEHLRQAVHALELAASLGLDEHTKGLALLKLGWVHRVLGDWESSTRTWDRCAHVKGPPKLAADALWLAAENLEWTNRPAEAAERLDRMVRGYPDDARRPMAMERIVHLEAEAHRSSDWLIDPVASLKAEIETRTSNRTPREVYRSVKQELQRRGKHEALIAVSRWACDQTDWPEQVRIRPCFDLTDALIHGANETGREEAVQRLWEIVEVASDDATAVHAALRCCRTLNKLDRHGEADRMIETITRRVKGSKRFEPVVLTHYAESLLQRRERDRALQVMDRLIASYPDYGVSERLEALRNGNRAEGGR